MPLAKPGYIAAGKIDDPTIRYEWDDQKPLSYCQQIDQALVDYCARLRSPAIVGLTIAEAEWLMFRFEQISGDPLPFKYLEAAWCANVDPIYSRPVEFPKPDWQGPVRRPMHVAVALLNNMLYEYDEDAKAKEHPALMSSLVEHVLPGPEARASFLRWRDLCLGRLLEFFMESEVDPFEDLFNENPETPILVPREVFDPEFDFRSEIAQDLVDRFLRNIDYEKNPFLLTPEQMRAEGFMGIPYSLFAAR